MLSLSLHAIRRPKLWFWSSAVISVILILLVLIPTLNPSLDHFLNPLRIDTDPENMLSENEEVRVFHNEMKKKFDLNDIIVVGVINDQSENGVFNAKTLKNIYELTEYAKTLSGVIASDIIAPSTVDNIEQGGIGSVRFEWLMQTPPANDQSALEIAKKAANIPFLKNTLISDDNKALALYIPITSKNVSFEIAEKLRQKISEFDSPDQYHITGLPIAQDQFGVEMFVQMAVSAPMAMILIFLLMWLFFRHTNIIIAPMIVAMISVLITMGLLVITGNTVHIMSSMIPIFIMPIAVLDAVHILSDFFDKYPKNLQRKQTLLQVMDELSKPMFYTSVTTCAGFASLAFTPIPPVQIFGIFIAIGVFFAWILTITLVPAYIMLLSEHSLKGFGLNHLQESTFLTKLLKAIGEFTYNRARIVILSAFILAGVAYYGIGKIQINDNPVKWFVKSHDIRVADLALNEKFAGTYMAYLELAPIKQDVKINLKDNILAELSIINNFVYSDIKNFIANYEYDDGLIEALINYILDKQDAAQTDQEWEDWDVALIVVDQFKQSDEIFKDPQMLKYIESLQNYLLTTNLVGKSNALPDIVKTVHRELFLGSNDQFIIPNSKAAIAQTLITYQSSHRPHDLWHFVTPDYKSTNLWLQLKTGDNKDMNKVVAAVDEFLDNNTAPFAIQARWFGLTYINTVWQDKMVSGMLDAFTGSFIIVLFMMILLFRSFVWGVLCMIPLTITIGLIYGLIGLVGKDYDMPVAVLSSLSLGLAVDYAIHFLARSRELYQGNWQKTNKLIFGEPARAIARNVVVIGVGFLPLLAAPLVPYKTVGIFISAILFFAGAATLFLLPAIITVSKNFIFKKKKNEKSFF
jgi:predicted RND superfamily exporter protein